MCHCAIENVHSMHLLCAVPRCRFNLLIQFISIVSNTRQMDMDIVRVAKHGTTEQIASIVNCNWIPFLDAFCAESIELILNRNRDSVDVSTQTHTQDMWYMHAFDQTKTNCWQVISYFGWYIFISGKWCMVCTWIAVVCSFIKRNHETDAITQVHRMNFVCLSFVHDRIVVDFSAVFSNSTTNCTRRAWLTVIHIYMETNGCIKVDTFYSWNKTN